MAGRAAISLRRIASVSIGAASLLLGGCAPEPHIVSSALQEPGAPRRTVCVLSTVGKTFALQKVGIMVFGNDHSTTGIAAWGIDDLVAREIASLTKGHVETKAIPVAVPNPASVRETNPYNRGIFHKDDPAWEAIKKDAAADKACDLLLTVTQGGSKVGSTNQFISGLGILETPGGTFVHALVVLYLYDARTMQQITWAAGWSKRNPLVDMISGPHRKVDNSWRVQPAAVAASRQHKEAIEALVRVALAETVPKVLSFKQSEPATAVHRGQTHSQSVAPAKDRSSQ
jgi:hypothetical protein